MEFDQVVWLLDQRFDFLLPWFEKEYNISRKDILFVGSYHGNTRKDLKTVTVGNSSEGHVSYLEPEDINRLYADGITAGKKTLVVPFSGAYLPSAENMVSLIATGKVAIDTNNKWWQYEFFSKSGVKTPETWRVENHSLLLDLTRTLFGQHESLLIKKAELAGGYKMKIVSSVEDVCEYCKMQKEDFLNGEFLVSEYIPHEQSFSGMGVIGRDGKVIWCGATEQVLYKDLAYEGLIWPPYIDDRGLCDIKRITLKVGERLSEYGYFGYYNVDFIQGAGKMYAVEINARFCFSTILYACCCGEKFWKAVQGEEVIESQVDGRLILGKIKARKGRGYSKLADKSNILEWFNSGIGGFQTFFVGTDELECYDYGSFIGLFGEFLPKDSNREDALRLFWDSCLQQYKKKVLRCMYVDDFCGIKKECFNFSIERRYSYMIKKGKINRKNDEEIEGFPKDFWGDNVSAVTLLIGENGAGKTTLMRLLIKWLCQLSVGHIPQEKGALIISVSGEDNDQLIAFGKGEPWDIKTNKNEKIVCIQDRDEIKKLLSDIRLVYYTDTMTDLELSDTLTLKELAFLQDDSLLTRLSNSIKDGYTVETIKDCIKREDFKRQMELFLHCKENPNNLPQFPIRYMKFTAIKAGDEKSFDEILDGNDSLREKTIDLWNKEFADDAKYNLSAIAKALLWGLFSGTIRSLLQWERTLSNLGKSIVTEQLGYSLREYNRTNYDWDTVFTHFFKNLFSDCKREFLGVQRVKEFCDKWEKQQIEDRINSFLGTLKKLEDGGFLEKWKSFENTQSMWQFELEYFDGKNENNRIVLEEWKSLWKCYLAVAHLMPKCKFDWKYASSGGKNRSNLYVNLFNIVKECRGKEINQLWVFLDEPDNTFHPDWERRIIQNLLEICSNFNINFQMLISTHSPIMLSDVPKQAAILLKSVEEKKNDGTIEKKEQIYPESKSFGQQIYTLFNDAFFMKQGIIGAFADEKIGEVYKELHKIEEKLSERKNIQEENTLESFERDLKKYESIIDLIDEPILHGHLSQSYKLCNRRIKELRNILRKEGIINDKNETV